MNVLDDNLLAGGARELAAQAVDADPLADVAAEVNAGGGAGVGDDVVLLVDQGEGGLAVPRVFEGDQAAAGVESLVDFSGLRDAVNHGGPLGAAGVVRQLADHTLELGRRTGVELLEFRNRVRSDLGLAVSHRKITVLLDLPENADSLWGRFPSKLRSQIRRPQKDGIRVRFGLDQVEPFFTVFSHHMRDLGTPTQPLRLFQAIAEEFPKDVWFGCAYLRDRPVAAGCGFAWGREFEMTWAASLKNYSRLAPNMLLYWRFIERAISNGIRVFNFGRCTPGGGTHRFKAQWGGRDEPLWWYRHATTTRTLTPSPEERQYRWGSLVWRRLPVRAANALGPRIVQYIP